LAFRLETDFAFIVVVVVVFSVLVDLATAVFSLVDKILLKF